MINLLLMVHIGSEILTSKDILKEVDAENKEILLNYNMYKGGSLVKSVENERNYGKYWKLVKAIDMSIDGQPYIFYFSLPFNDSLRNK
jgi:hypothetical protein